MFESKPLAERMRPATLDDYVGQEHLVGQGKVLRRMIDTGVVSSFILWGPPGVGKTTLAMIIAKQLDRPFYVLSAVSAGVKEVREVIQRAEKDRFFSTANPILIDEIHRFSKSQQDSLLAAVEKGIVTLIGATTENPSFEVISPLLSRCQVYVLKAQDKKSLEKLLDRAVETDVLLKERSISFESKEAIMAFCGGDARKALNILELTINSQPINVPIVITDAMVKAVIQENPLIYDKDGEQHYDIVSAMIKSIRGGNPNAAVYYMSRMLAGGEDPLFIARRLIISASEDIGLANPNAMLIANACFDAVHKIGMPEARIPLANCIIYLASSPKSNSAYMAVNSAMQFVERSGNIPVPLHLRNAPTKLMKELNYGTDYKYPHDYPGNFVDQEYMPEEIKNMVFYKPQNNAQELKMLERLKVWWRKIYGR